MNNNISYDNLYILKDYSNTISKFSFDGFRFKNEKEVIEYYTKDTKELEKLNELKKNKELYENFIECITGKKTLPLMYDSVFKKIFDFETHPERLASLLTSILGYNVKIIGIFKNEGNISPKGPGVIFDIVVKMEDNSVADVEAQKIPYDFTGKRMSVYSSALTYHMYKHLRSIYGTELEYDKMNKVYTIVIFEKTTKEFKKPSLNNRFVFHGKTVFDDDLELDMTQEFYLIALDVFRDHEYSIDIESIKINEMSEEEFKKCCTYELSIWLQLLLVDNEEEMRSLSEKYPWIAEILVELIEFMQNPEEALNMYSNIYAELAETDRVSIEHYNEKLRAMIEEKDSVIEEKDSVIEEKDSLIAQDKLVIEQQDKKIIEIMDYLSTINISLPNYIIGIDE